MTRRIQFDLRISLGNICAAIVFIIGAAIWYATVGADIRAIKEDIAELNSLKLRVSANETSKAVYDERSKWIIESLDRIQRERGILPPPQPKN